MSKHKIDPGKKPELDVRTWQLPDLEGPPVNSENAIGHEALAETRRQQTERRTEQKTAQQVNERTTEAADEHEGDEETPAPPTAAELQAIRDAAREEGLHEGRNVGYREGFEKGHHEGRQHGHTEGYEAGETAGRDDADAAAKAELAETQRALSDRFARAISRVQEAEQDLEQELAPVVRDLVLRLAQGLVVQSLQQSPEQIEDIIHKAIQLLPSQRRRTRLFLHPEDYALLKSQDIHWLEQVNLHADDTMAPGGCRISTEHSLLDYTLDARYREQISTLLEWPDAGMPAEELRQFQLEQFQQWVSQLSSAQNPDKDPGQEDNDEAR